jgi:hypothetical protein
VTIKLLTGQYIPIGFNQGVSFLVTPGAKVIVAISKLHIQCLSEASSLILFGIMPPLEPRQVLLLLLHDAFLREAIIGNDI